jgi:hypothetical protein
MLAIGEGVFILKDYRIFSFNWKSKDSRFIMKLVKVKDETDIS